MPLNTRPRAAGSKKNTKFTATKPPPNNEPVKDNKSGSQLSSVPGTPISPPIVTNAASSTSQVDEDNHHSVNGVSASSSTAPAPTVNRKKQKRREKQAARLVAEQQLAAESRAAQPAVNPPYKDHASGLAEPPATLNGFDYGASDYDEADQYEPAEGEDLYYTDDDGHLYERSFGVPSSGFLPHPPISRQPDTRKSKKRAKGQDQSFSQQRYASPYPTSHASHFRAPPPPPPPPPMSSSRSAHHVAKDRIWNTSTQEERERIKEFWLSLGEEDRRSLVKVEKEAVLKKMKEQQKHSCSCTVCGRKRTAIEEELEVLYDAYYEELEQYANHQQISLVDGTPIMPTAGLHHPMSRFAPNRNPPPLNYQRASKGRISEIPNGGEEEVDEDEYSDEDEDEEYSDEEPEEEPLAPQQANDFFNFGNNLTVQGGILTVADDLLKNDGKKFIEMMEQLAERRMQREEDAQYAAAAGLSHPAIPSHNHGPPVEDDVFYDDDEEDEDSYESGDDEDYEDDEMETMTEEQRMEEGRRMFQIFAARMFEQRVLTAYREKVAAERQQKLIEELEEESRLDTQREAKKAKEAQKKKDKKRQLKLKQEEERAQREAKKAAEEAAAREVEEKKLEEQRQKKEEQRKKKEAEKKAQEEERLRKEAEKQRRLQEAKEQQAEQERKQREQKERERKKRDEARKKEREEKEAKDKAAAEKKDREAAGKREKEVKAQAARDANDQARKHEQATKSSTAVPVPEVLSSKPTRPPAQTRSSHASPHLPVAIPVVPKAPTPIRVRQASFQDPHLSSPKTSQAPSAGSTTSPGLPGGPQSNRGSSAGKSAQALPQQPRQTPPFYPASNSSTLITQPPGLPPMGGNGYPPNFGPMMPSATSRAPMQEPSFGNHPPISSPQQRHFLPQNGLPFAPGMNATRQAVSGRGGPMDVPTTQGLPSQVPMSQSGTHTQYIISRDTMPSHSRSHSRQTSTSLERSTLDTPSITAPIARPAPIQRPSSVTPQQQGEKERPRRSDVDDLANHLGSSALLDDTDIPLTSAGNNPRRGSVAPGGPYRQGFGAGPMFTDSIGTAKMDNLPRGSQGGNGNTWGTPHMPFGASPMASSPQWAHAPGSGWPNNNAFGMIVGANRPNAPRPFTIRLLICQACNKLTASQPSSHRTGFHPVDAVLRQVELMKPANEGTITLQEMLDICDTEGNNQNGGGSFAIDSQGDTGTFVKFESGRNTSMSTRGGVPGDIGSPIPGSAFPGFGGLRPFQQPGSLHNPGF
ncbi:MAG: hypothetical protein LQ343_003504 [Gyalolechia ehrenbergii]|nr:MAG: hypothetical protein LQ343_003504 [Gyalolechia ehrenbergii]